MSREITRGGGHAGGNAGFEHFGLGAADTAFVRVTWPDGAVSEAVKMTPNQAVILNRIGNGFEISD